MPSDPFSQERLAEAGLYVGLATAYAVFGYAAGVLKDDSRTFSPYRFGKTVAVGVAAGLIMMANNATANIEGVEAAMAIAIPIVDKALNAFGAARQTNAE